MESIALIDPVREWFQLMLAQRIFGVKHGIAELLASATNLP